MRIITPEEFGKMSAYEKGYTVYMFGERSDQPNVPMKYTPTVAEAEDYYRGQHHAMLETQDSEE